ncbi:MAG: sulfurtransferase/chromate resistance protein [Beijerinckiaceae bacterium]|jgi:rhodanese-related sulfurtransferase|nr:sulfurtransferase/chromate resistance protein [Beijerinckiaceae bacterium]
MSSTTSITFEKLSRLIGRADCPVLIDVCTEPDFACDPRLVPGAIRRSHDDVAHWGPAHAGQDVVVICQKGLKLSEGVAGWLRHFGARARNLEGGAMAWAKAGLPMLVTARVPERRSDGSTLWVTRTRPKIDRIACPWLIRRFIDPSAVFLFVSPAEVRGVAERFGATSFDIEGEDQFWSHRGEACTFDMMVSEFGLACDALHTLAAIVRGADTARLDLAPEAAGLLAVSLGLSRMFSDDLRQLEAGMLIYDALYRWCSDAMDETHNWPAARPSAKVSTKGMRL